MHSPVFPILVSVAALLALIGCNPGSTEQSDPTIITVVGDETAASVIEELSIHGFEINTTLDHQPRSSAIVIVQDSTKGPIPVHLEIAKSLQNRPAKELFWVFTNTDPAMVDDQELLELEELECRELFISQGLPGKTVVFGFDSTTACVSPNFDCPKGWDAIVRHLKDVARRH